MSWSKSNTYIFRYYYDTICVICLFIYISRIQQVFLKSSTYLYLYIKTDESMQGASDKLISNLTKGGHTNRVPNETFGKGLA